MSLFALTYDQFVNSTLKNHSSLTERSDSSTTLRTSVSLSSTSSTDDLFDLPITKKEDDAISLKSLSLEPVNYDSDSLSTENFFNTGTILEQKKKQQDTQDNDDSPRSLESPINLLDNDDGPRSLESQINLPCTLIQEWNLPQGMNNFFDSLLINHEETFFDDNDKEQETFVYCSDNEEDSTCEKNDSNILARLILSDPGISQCDDEKKKNLIQSDPGISQCDDGEKKNLIQSDPVSQCDDDEKNQSNNQIKKEAAKCYPKSATEKKSVVDKKKEQDKRVPELTVKEKSVVKKNNKNKGTVVDKKRTCLWWDGSRNDKKKNNNNQGCHVNRKKDKKYNKKNTSSWRQKKSTGKKYSNPQELMKTMKIIKRSDGWTTAVFDI